VIIGISNQVLELRFEKNESSSTKKTKWKQRFDFETSFLSLVMILSLKCISTEITLTPVSTYLTLIYNTLKYIVWV